MIGVGRGSLLARSIGAGSDPTTSGRTRLHSRHLHAAPTHPDSWRPVLEAAARGTVTLLYSAHDVLHNGAVVLRDYLAERHASPDHRRQKGAGHRRRSTTAGAGRDRSTRPGSKSSL